MGTSLYESFLNFVELLNLCVFHQILKILGYYFFKDCFDSFSLLLLDSSYMHIDILRMIHLFTLFPEPLFFLCVHRSVYFLLTFITYHVFCHSQSALGSNQ